MLILLELFCWTQSTFCRSSLALYMNGYVGISRGWVSSVDERFQEFKASQLQSAYDYTERVQVFLALSRQIQQVATDYDGESHHAESFNGRLTHELSP